MRAHLVEISEEDAQREASKTVHATIFGPTKPAGENAWHLRGRSGTDKSCDGFEGFRSVPIQSLVAGKCGRVKWFMSQRETSKQAGSKWQGGPNLQKALVLLS